ncbi:MAG: diguanylate cyclase [Chloroflexi bacterium]|nr:diguanylate cyclase [Chloroflexota bacterium]
MKDLSAQARAYILVMIGVGSVVFLGSLNELPSIGTQWLTLGVLVVAAGLAQLYPVQTPKNQAYYVTVVFLFAGVLLLPAGALCLLVISAFVPEWIKIKYPWPIQLFNIANFTVNAYLAKGSYLWILGNVDLAILGNLRLASAGPYVLVAAVIAAVLFVLLNHALLAVALRLARGHTWRQTGLFEINNVLIDLTLSCTGIMVALLAQINLWLISLGSAPLFLIYKALNTPNLVQQARTDSKTGLYNAKYFREALEAEHSRAKRFGRPMTVVMADLDLLRNINNSYGHLAGDIVLKGVAEIILAGMREYDVAARFGGEEFALILPETHPGQARIIADRLRRDVEEARFVVPTNVQPIRVTLSFGIASFPDHGQKQDEVLHQADLALYYSKLNGRNQVWVASPESEALRSTLASQWLSARPREVVSPGAGNEPVHGQADALDVSCLPCAAGHGTDGPVNPVEGEVSENLESDAEGDVASIGTSQTSGLTWPIAALVVAVLGSCLVLWVLEQPLVRITAWWDLGVLLVLTVVSQNLAIDIYGRGKVSTSAIMIIAGGLIFGVPGVLLLGPAVALAQFALRRGVLYRALFDLGSLTLSGTASVLVYRSFDNWIVESDLVWMAVPAMVAGLAFYLSNIGLLCLAMGLSEKRSPLGIWQERFKWLVVHYSAFGFLALIIALAYHAIGIYGLISFFVPPVMLRYAMKQYIDHTVENVSELKRVNDELTSTQCQAVQTLKELRETYDATIAALSAALDSRDAETEGHCRRVADYARLIGQEFGLPPVEITAIVNGALLHDVGKIGVPDAVLRKDGPLTPAQWSTIRKHPDKGYRMLCHIKFLSDSMPVVRYHHERWDGQGYPEGLRGPAIPLGARIFAVADSFDAMTSHRPYRAPLTVNAARQEILACSGTQFDPQVVDAFFRLDVRQLAKQSGQPIGPSMPQHTKDQREAEVPHLRVVV